MRWLRRPIVLLVVGLAAAGLVLGALVPSPHPRWGDGINVVLITLDTTRQDRLSCYGYAHKTTPYIDAVAQESLLYRHAVAVSNWTLPSHASMLSGLYPTSHGARLVKEAPARVRHDDPSVEGCGAMSPSCETLAEVLHGSGYRTGAIVANAVYLQKAFNLDQGFDHYDDRCTCALCNPKSAEATVPYRDAREITSAAIEWLGRNRARPFFLFVNYLDPHIPYFPPPPFDRKFRDGRAERVEGQLPTPRTWRTHMELFRTAQAVLGEQPSEMPPDVIPWLSSQYDGELGFADEQVGRLVRWLRDQGIYDRTMIVITSDHGECFGEHRLLEHGNSFYEPELAVPMIVKLPYQKRTGLSDAGVQHVDIMPTVLETVGLPVPAAVQGTSMPAAGVRDLVAEKQVMSKDQVLHRYAVYRGRLKYLEDAQGNVELYNLEVDPHELHNLAKNRADDVDSLRQALATWKNLVVPIESVRPDSMRPEHERLLRDFGYLQ